MDDDRPVMAKEACTVYQIMPGVWCACAWIDWGTAGFRIEDKSVFTTQEAAKNALPECRRRLRDVLGSVKWLEWYKATTGREYQGDRVGVSTG